jgi:hypothetical protein
MADNKPSWIDYLNVGLTVMVGGIGIYIAVHLGESADRLSQNGLIVASATFLLDDSPVRRQGGVEIVSWLKDNEIVLPPWEEHLIQQIADQSDSSAPTGEGAVAPPGEAPASSAPAPQAPAASSPAAAPIVQPANQQLAQPSNQQIANQLFSVIGGKSPRLFLEIVEAEQRSGAEALRGVADQIMLNGQRLIVPKIENVKKSAPQVELRYLKTADREEAVALAGKLDKLLGRQIPVRDMSAQFEARADVKRRTYELWFPAGEQIRVQ